MVRTKRQAFKKPLLVGGKLSKPMQAQEELVRSGFLASVVCTPNANLLIQPSSTPALSEEAPLDFFAEKQELSNSSILSAFNNMMGFRAINVEMMQLQVALMHKSGPADSGVEAK